MVSPMSYVSYAQAKLNKQEVISDYFDNDSGQLTNYGTIDLNQAAALITQKHTDLRSFYQAVYKTPYIVDLSSKTMTNLQGTQMQNINAPILVKAGETWTGGSNTIDTTSTWKRLKFNCSTTPVTVYSKTNSININQYATDGYITFALPSIPSLSTDDCFVSITTDTTPTGFASGQTDTFALDSSNVILTTVNGNAELKIATNKLTNVLNSNNINKGLITGIKFVIQLSTGTGYFYCSAIRCVSGSWKYAPLDVNTLENKIVKTVPPNGVLPTATLQTAMTELSTSIDVGSSNIAKFPTAGIVLINNIEYVSYTGKSSSALTGLTRGINGGAPKSHAVGVTVTLHDFNYPVNNTGSGLPTKWPALYRTFDSSGQQVNDLGILHGGAYAVINTGGVLGETATSADPNNFSFYFRHRNRFVRQKELNNQTQAYINALKNINDIVSTNVDITQGDLSKVPGTFASTTFSSPLSGTYQDNPNSMGNNSGLTQETLNARTQATLETINNGGTIAYLGTHLKWYKNASDNTKLRFQIDVTDELSTLFSFTIDHLLSYWLNKTLVFKAELIDKTIECKIFELKNNTLTLVYTTGRIESNFFHREKGSFGWSAELKDGQTQIQSIRSNRMIYGEYKSSIINSITPVKGAQIFANQTAEKELITEIKSNPWTVSTKALSATIDNTNIQNPIKTYTVTDPNQGIWQGIETNTFYIENFEDIYIKFDIYYASNNNMAAYLYDKTINKLFRLNFPTFNLGQWKSIRLIASGDKILPGYYSLIVLEDGYNNNTPWSIKNVSIKQREVNWEARSFVDGPWGIDDRDWMRDYFVNLIPDNSFSNISNKNDGVMFTKQDTELQIRAHALNPYVKIYNFDVQPKYATLGNLILDN